MGNILMTGSGGSGAGSDDCTGTAAELLKGYTGILKGSDDEPIPGTLELTGNAQAAHVLNGETFYTNNAKSKQTGTMPNRGDYNGWGNSKGNDAGNQRMWVKVPHGYYNENANVFLSWADIRNMAGITADKIKKNEPIMGIIGSFEGWVPTPQDLYYNGVNTGGFELIDGQATYENTRINLVYTKDGSNTPIRFIKSIDVRSYSQLIIEGEFRIKGTSTSCSLKRGSQSLAGVTLETMSTKIHLNISQLISLEPDDRISFRSINDLNSCITRIRLA